jgi:hypothetical protein
MPAKAERKKGAPKDSRKAKKRGFYSKALDEAEQLDFDLAAGVEGIDDEIALLRLEIKKAIMGGDPKTLELLVKATNALERLVRTRYNISKEQGKGLKEAIENVLKEIAIPLGIGIGQIITK